MVPFTSKPIVAVSVTFPNLERIPAVELATEKLNALPYPFSRWTDQRDFPSVAKKTFRERWKEIKAETG